MYTTCCLTDTPLKQNVVCLCQRAKIFCQTQIHGENNILIFRSRSYRVHECARHIEPWWYTHMPNKVWLGQRHVINPIKFDLEIKVQGRIRIMNVLDTFSHGDRPVYQIWYANVKANRSYRSEMKTWQKPINLTLRSKVNIKSGSGMYATHRLRVIHPCAKYGKPMSIQKKIWAVQENMSKAL